jgi:hypothetical protein
VSINAGSIVHVAGTNVIDRIQSAGLNDVRITQDVIHEVGNNEIVDKIPGDPDFTFSLNTLDVSCEVEAWLSGERPASESSNPASGAGASDPAGTAYNWSDFGFVNVPSPWKDPSTGSAGTVGAGHLIPAYYCNRVHYEFGATENSQETFDLSGGSYYYNGNAPVEDHFVGDGADTTFPSTRAAVGYRIGGADGTTFRHVFGVIVDGELQTEGVDYTQDNGGAVTTAVTTVTFTTAPALGKSIVFCYFTTHAEAFPDSVHPSTIVKPAAVRGRHVCVYLGSGGSRAKVGSVQAFVLDGTVDATVEREMCNEEIVGVTINSRDTNGSMTVRSKNSAAFLALASKVTGVPVAEVIGWLNTHAIPIEVAILNPKNPAETLKTLYVDDALFQIPGTAARANQPTDFQFGWESRSGDFTVYKGAKP